MNNSEVTYANNRTYLSMSRRQCSVWGCYNRKGRCPEDVHLFKKHTLAIYHMRLKIFAGRNFRGFHNSDGHPYCMYK